MSQKGFGGIIVLIVVLILSGLAGAYYFDKSQTPKPQTQTISQTPQPTPDETVYTEASRSANWKTYKSPYGYTINYPLNAELIDCEGRCNFEAQIKKPELLITLGVSGLPLNRKLSDYLYYGFCQPKGNTRKEKINNLIFYKSEKIYNADNICLDAVVDLNKKTEDSYQILDIQAKAYNQDGVKLFNQIISTFKFTQ